MKAPPRAPKMGPSCAAVFFRQRQAETFGQGENQAADGRRSGPAQSVLGNVAGDTRATDTSMATRKP